MLKLAPIFQDYAVLQRGEKICVWGQCDPGAEVSVRLGQLYAVSRGDARGRWSVRLSTGDTARGLKLVAQSGSETVTCENVCLGEVWLAGGQSNMEFLMKYDARRQQAYELPPNMDLRYYCCPKVSYEQEPEDKNLESQGFWRIADRENLPWFSAVGYYFQRELSQGLDGVPVGVIDCTWGGTSASCWMDDQYLTGDLDTYLALRRETEKLDLPRELETYRQVNRQRNTPEALAAMDRMMETPIEVPSGFVPSPEEIEQFRRTKYAPFSPFSAATLYHTMLEPVIPYTVKGFLWYQGEEDTNYPHLHRELLKQMIRCWRDAWQRQLPFLLVQLPTYKNPGGWNPLNYVPIRQAQEEAIRGTDCAWLVCTLDVGMPYEIHPKQKQPVGQRLAYQALHHVYGQELASDPPQVWHVEKRDGELRIRFSDCAGGLRLRHGNTPIRLTVNGETRIWTCTAEQDTLTIHIPGLRVTDRVRLEYAVVDYCEPTLFNSVGHPALPFTVVV